MTQHILIGDLAPLALVGGLTGPILRPLLALHPSAAADLPPVRRAGAVGARSSTCGTSRSSTRPRCATTWAHALEHACFFVGGTLVWVPLLETLPMPEWFGTGMKMAFIAAVRVFESILGNVFVWANTAVLLDVDDRPTGRGT